MKIIKSILISLSLALAATGCMVGPNLEKPVVIIANKSQGNEELTALLSAQGLSLAASIPLKTEYHKALLNGEILSQCDQQISQLLQQAVAAEVIEQ